MKALAIALGLFLLTGQAAAVVVDCEAPPKKIGRHTLITKIKATFDSRGRGRVVRRSYFQEAGSYPPFEARFKYKRVRDGFRVFTGQVWSTEFQRYLPFSIKVPRHTFETKARTIPMEFLRRVVLASEECEGDLENERCEFLERWEKESFEKCTLK